MPPLSLEDDLSQRIHNAQPSMLFKGHTPEELAAFDLAITILDRWRRGELEMNSR